VERAFAPATSQACADEARWITQQRTLRELAQPWVDAALDALAWLLGRTLLHPEEKALQEACELALSAEPDVGSLDYHAANVILDRNRQGPPLSFVDFPAVGVDWPARRLVQYGTATGSSSAGGGFVPALGPAAVRAYAGNAVALRSGGAARLAQEVDAHEVLLLATAAQSLAMCERGEAHPSRAAAWSNVRERRTQLLALLRRSLVSEGSAERLRAALRRRA